LLFRKADIEDPPDISVHEHSQYSRGFLFREANIKVPLDYNIHAHYLSERFQKIKANSQQSCGTDNQIERLTYRTHGPDQRLLHRATCARSREQKNKSTKDTDITAP
jgi:hypothetical protein